MNICRFLKSLLLLAGLNFLLLDSALAAEPIGNIYEARVPLLDRSENARRRAISEGLEQVLIRSSGYSGVGTLAGVTGALANAERYAIEFSVEAREIPAEDGLSTKRAEVLWVRYSASQVDELIDRQQLPIWPTMRPTLRYLVIQELWGEPEFILADNFPAMESVLQQVFYARGLTAEPFQTQELEAEEIWDLDEIDAYQFYQAAEAELLVLIRVLSNDSKMTGAEVLFVQESGLSVYRQKKGEPVKDVAAAINEFVDGYSADYVFLGGSGQASDFYISVLGMENFVSYRAFLEVISDLEQVNEARLEAFRNDQMLFRVSYSSNPERLLTAIMQQTELAELPDTLRASGTRKDPLLLAPNGYQLDQEIEPIFSPPQIVRPQPLGDSLPPADILPEE